MIGAIGIDAVRHIRQRREFIALAWIPLLLGAHQFIEALVWLWLQGHVPRGIGHVALWAYLLIAFSRPKYPTCIRSSVGTGPPR